jgi:hypothetical protein
VTLRILEPNELDLAAGEDVADFVSQLKVVGKNDAEITAALTDALETAKTVSVAGVVRQRFADIVSGRYTAIHWPWELVHALTHALLPMTISLLVGSAGAAKSFLALQAFVFWMEMGLRVALFEAEEDRVYHLTRTLAQKSGCGWLTDTDLVKERADEADRIAEQHKDFLEAFGRVLHTTSDVELTLEQLASWVETQAKAGCRIIGIDPVSAAERTGDVWAADARFLRALQRTAREYACSILLLTHPTKKVTFPDLTQIAGGAAFQRFTQTVFWLEYHEAKCSNVRTAVGTSEFEHNGTLHLLKARNGRGTGMKLAFDFDTDSLTWSELGIIRKKHKGAE